MTGSPDARCQIDLPGRAASVDVARHFVVVAFRVWGLDEELVDDARLAVSEMATAAVVGGTDRFSVTCERVGSTVTVTIGPVGPAGMMDGPVDRRDIVETLFPESALDGEDFVVVVRS